MTGPAAVLRCGLALVLLLVAGCDGGPAAPSLRGARIEVVATWSDAEQERFTAVLDAFSRRTGVVVDYTPETVRLPELLAERVAAGDPPDVGVLPQPGLMRDLVAAGALAPLGDDVREVAERHFPARFVDLGSVDGELYGVWFKAANKSLVWYDVATFERLGAVPPHDLDGLLALARRTTAAGVPAFAVSATSGWTLTDWFENLYLRRAGADAYDDLAERRTPWTDPSVVRALEEMSALLAPDAVAPGWQGADFADSVHAVADDPARAAMVVEGDFVAGVVSSETAARPGVDLDVFPFPAAEDGAPAVVGGGDVAVLLRASAAASALLRWLASPEAAAVWAAEGGFVSPNLDLDLAAYPDDVSRVVARRLLEAGEDFRFDLSDLQPAAFGGSEETGLFPELRRFLVERDAVATASRLEAAARSAWEDQ